MKIGAQIEEGPKVAGAIKLKVQGIQRAQGSHKGALKVDPEAGG